MRWISVGLLAGLLVGLPASSKTVYPLDHVALRASAVRDRFDAAIRACGATPTYLASVDVNTPPDGISYGDYAHTVNISRWSKLAPQVQAAMQGWAAQGTLGLDAEGQFGEIFNEFLVAHELGHYLEFMSGRGDALDDWQNEVEANQIALAFWSLQPADAARLPQRIENFTRFLSGLPSPVPKGQDPRAYFADHYTELGKDLAAYGWYQGQFMKAAAADPSRDFCAWVKLNPPKAK